MCQSTLLDFFSSSYSISIFPFFSEIFILECILKSKLNEKYFKENHERYLDSNVNCNIVKLLLKHTFEFLEFLKSKKGKRGIWIITWNLE